MLQQLPVEISYKIFTLLDNLELLKCSETCRVWNTFINTKALIRELGPLSRNQLNSVMIAAKKGYISCNQITSFSTHKQLCSVQHCAEEIPRLFPAVKTFTTGKLLFSDNFRIPIIEKLNAYKKWQETLEVLHIGGFTKDISMLLEICRFERLTELQVDFFISEMIDPNDNTLFRSLKYVPQLRILRSNRKVYTLNSLDILHKSLPLLEELELTYIPRVPGFNIPENVTLVDTLTHLSLKLVMIFTPGGYTALFQFITQKYHSLTHLELSNHTLYPSSVPNQDDRESEFLLLTQQLPPTLRSFKNMLTRTTLPMIDALNYAITSKQLPVLTELFIAIHRHYQTNIDTWLNCFSKDMFKSLKSLVLEIDDTTKLNTMIPCATSVTKLDIKLMPELTSTIYLDCILDLHPLLHQLTITSLNAKLDVRNNNKEGKLHVRKFTIRLNSISKKIIPFIRKMMPNLKQLYIVLDQKFIQKTTNLDDPDDNGPYSDLIFKQPIYLPDHHLEDIRLYACDDEIKADGIICSVKDSMGRRYYFYDGIAQKVIWGGTDLAGIGLAKGVFYSYLHIECKALANLTVNGIKIF